MLQCIRELLPFVVITSGVDGTHMRASKHYDGLALDIRSKGMFDKKGTLQRLKTVLGSDFDVILEAEGKDNEHIHVEFDPK